MIPQTTPAALARFDAICQTVQDRGRGMSLGEIGDAHALARELEASEPDPERIAFLAERLDLDLEDGSLQTEREGKQT